MGLISVFLKLIDGNCKSESTYTTKKQEIGLEVNEARANIWSTECRTKLRNEGKRLGKSVPLQGLEWPRGFQEFKVTRLRDNGTG